MTKVLELYMEKFAAMRIASPVVPDEFFTDLGSEDVSIILNEPPKPDPVAAKKRYIVRRTTQGKLDSGLSSGSGISPDPVRRVDSRSDFQQVIGEDGEIRTTAEIEFGVAKKFMNFNFFARDPHVEEMIKLYWRALKEIILLDRQRGYKGTLEENRVKVRARGGEWRVRGGRREGEGRARGGRREGEGRAREAREGNGGGQKVGLERQGGEEEGGK
jgi:hypothetical protein